MKLRDMMVGCLVWIFASGLQARSFDEVNYTPSKTTFCLFAPNDAKAVVVRLYKDATNLNAIRTLSLKRTGNQTWTGKLKGNLKGLFYTFDTGHGECPGVFARAVGVNGKRGAILNLRDTDPRGWDADRRPALKSPADLVIYELHHRDFSIDASSGLVYKGKFLALTEPKAIRYLQDLGVNAIHILPSFDFASIDETRLDIPQYNWGYDPLNYNVPEGSYATDPYNPIVRIREFKQMVMALHQAGIRVILDVVYNHTFDIKHSNFQLTYPDYFYRKTADGQYSNGSGCGNETASEQPMMRQFMLQSVKYWIQEYHVDGFRFDLMGVHDIETMNAIRTEVNRIDPSIFIYGEGWSAGNCALPESERALKANIAQMPGIAAFSDDLRDAFRGPFSDDHQGAFLAGIPGEEESVKFGLVGAIAHPQVDMSKVNYDKKPWATEPVQQISYVSCHDDMCLVDRLRTEIPGLKTDELIRLDELAQTAVLTSQGVPFILCGEEMLRDKKGVHNSYQSPDSINRLDWNHLKQYPQVFAYYKALIQLRKDHPAFRLGQADLVRKHLEFLPTQKAMVGFVLKDHAGGDAWEKIIVLLNGSKTPKEVSIPYGNYRIVCQDGVIDEGGLGNVVSDQVSVHPQSALILHN